jgi:hypothetical protein
MLTGAPQARAVADCALGRRYRATPDPDAVYLYTDDVIGILRVLQRSRAVSRPGRARH